MLKTGKIYLRTYMYVCTYVRSCGYHENKDYSKHNRKKRVFPPDTQWKLQLSHDLALGGHTLKTVVKRTAMGKRVRFFFTMFSTSGFGVVQDYLHLMVGIYGNLFIVKFSLIQDHVSKVFNGILVDVSHKGFDEFWGL